MQPAKVLCIHALSGEGRCGLNEALPVLAACGVQGCALPTGLLSTHTGGFGIPARMDTFAFACAALEHYERMSLRFDGIYSGYLGDAACAGLVQHAYEQYPGALKIIDPVLGDHGQLYRSIAPQLIEQMKQLCRMADYITPNVTESAFLLDLEPQHTVMSKAQAIERMRQLEQRFRASVVLTGIELENGACANGLMLREGAPTLWKYHAQPGAYPGTGDLFAAAFTGGLLRGDMPQKSLACAAAFVEAAVACTYERQTQARFGVHYEQQLLMLSKQKETRLF